MKQDNGNHAATPGPWKSQYGNDGDDGFMEWWDIRTDDDIIAKAFDPANARLIAAAPELLSALENAIEALDSARIDDVAVYLDTNGRAALAKAKGD